MVAAHRDKESPADGGVAVLCCVCEPGQQHFINQTAVYHRPSPTRRLPKADVRILGIALVVLLVSRSAGMADFQDGNGLLDACKGQLGFGRDWLHEQGLCYGYLAAVSDILAYQAVGDFRSCVPPGVNLMQLEDIVERGLEDVPAIMRHHDGGAGLVAAILSRAFPCSDN
jgi:hypothetical protein